MLQKGDKVVVLSPSEIAATLDADGALEGLPFMPEMLSACGRVFTVAMRAERVCARGLPPGESPLRRLEGCVVLEGVRCDGAAHAGCQLGCTVLWKEAWLAPAGARAGQGEPPAVTPSSPAALPIELRTHRRGTPAALVCQGTELVRASRPGPSRWSPWPYLRLLQLRTLSPLELAGALARTTWFRVARGLGRRRAGAPGGEEVLRLQPGEWVEVKSAAEIRATLDARMRHRGLSFSADMVPYCGRRLRVRSQVQRIVQEESGGTRVVRDTITLVGADCQRHLGCARQMPFLWREAWVRRAPAPPEVVSLSAPPTARASGAYLTAKRTLDVITSCVALLLLSPVLAAIALAVRLSSRGPVLFRQERIGLLGRPFTMLKFRSMADAPGPSITGASDPRITRVGRVLRRFKLDELPQLWNVLVGDMSLVGPRPELARYVELFPAEYRRILTVRPGLTDFAALAFRDEEVLLAGPSPEYAYVQTVLPAKLPLYSRYLDEMSLRTDLRLVLRTLAAVLR